MLPPVYLPWLFIALSMRIIQTEWNALSVIKGTVSKTISQKRQLTVLISVLRIVLRTLFTFRLSVFSVRLFIISTMEFVFRWANSLRIVKFILRVRIALSAKKVIFLMNLRMNALNREGFWCPMKIVLILFKVSIQNARLVKKDTNLMKMGIVFLVWRTL